MEITAEQAKERIYALLDSHGMTAGRDYMINDLKVRDYYRQEDEGYISITAENGAGDVLYIDVTDEITFGFDAYHAHYYFDEDDYEEFKGDLTDLFSGNAYSMCCYAGDKWIYSTFQRGSPDREYLIKRDIDMGYYIKKYGSVKVVCKYWESGKSVTFDLPKKSLSEKLGQAFFR